MVPRTESHYNINTTKYKYLYRYLHILYDGLGWIEAKYNALKQAVELPYKEMIE